MGRGIDAIASIAPVKHQACSGQSTRWKTLSSEILFQGFSYSTFEADRGGNENRKVRSKLDLMGSYRGHFLLPGTKTNCTISNKKRGFNWVEMKLLKAIIKSWQYWINWYISIWRFFCLHLVVYQWSLYCLCSVWDIVHARMI